MMARPFSFGSLISFLLLFININAELSSSLQQTKVDQCPNPTVNACLFVSCANNGLCLEDSTTSDCFRCQCAIGFTGRMCDTPLVITPTACNPACINGGVCNGNTCFCPLGYSGSYCQVRDYCLPSNPCRNGGRCISTAVSYACDCSNTGYTGNICADTVVGDPCALAPCQNGGQCVSNAGTVACLCVNSYSGSSCQIPPVPCGTAPCENGGKCQLIVANTYACSCPQQFTGTRCETSILATHPCVTMPSAVCQNGGTCTVNGAGFLCKCATGWKGDNCQTRDVISACNPSPCGAFGTCLEAVLPSGPVALCSCADRWTGKYCDVNMDVNCPVGYCLSGGICRMNGNSPYCDCPQPYTGQRCESLVGSLTTTTTAAPGVNLCLPNPCSNGGTCLSSNNNYLCVCPTSWFGSTCTIYETTTTTAVTTTTITTVLGLCFSNPCMNGGTCYGNMNMFMCVCAPSWTGPTCTMSLPMTTTTTTTMTTTVSTPEAFCSSNTCSNGGTCYMFENTAICVCQWPWAGPRCNMNIDAVTTLTTTTTAAPGSNPCASHLCHYGGTCQSNGIFAVCNCVLPYTGTHCETIQSTTTPIMTTPPSSVICANLPCKNGGTCVPRGTSYSCFCGISSSFTGKNCDSTTPMSIAECPLNCAPGKCIFSGFAQKPYACLWNGTMRPVGGTTA